MNVYIPNKHKISHDFAIVKQHYDLKTHLLLSAGDLFVILIREEKKRIEAEKPKIPIGAYDYDYQPNEPDFD